MGQQQHRSRILQFLVNQRFVLVVYIFFAVVASISTYFEGKNWWFYTHYNNFLIFRQSFDHLIHNIDLYSSQVPEHYDFFKYSPTFAALMAPFAWLPVLPGLILWNLLNALALFFAIKSLPAKNSNTNIFILWFILQELLTTMQNSQSNGLLAALLIYSFSAFEKRNMLFASLFIVLTMYMKIYGALAAVLFLFYPDKLKFILYSAFWFVVLGLLPLLFINISQLTFLYKSWYDIIAHDHAKQYGISLMGLLHTWFNANPDKNILMLAGLILLLLPLVRTKANVSFNFRISFFASLLIWLIIFNFRAESSTYIMAMAGVAIWFFNSRKTTLDPILVIAAFIITSFSTTDLFPSYVYYHLVKPYTLKALPCILIWMKITFDLMTAKPFLEGTNPKL